MKAYAKTDVGKKRSMNQDFFYCSENVVGSFRSEERRVGKECRL